MAGADVMCGGAAGKGGRTVSVGGSLVVQMVPHHRRRLVQQVGLLALALPLERLLQQVDIVPPAGLNEELLWGGALFRGNRKLAVGSRSRHGELGEQSGKGVPRVPLRVPSWVEGRASLLVDRWTVVPEAAGVGCQGKCDCFLVGFRRSVMDPSMYRYRNGFSLGFRRVSGCSLHDRQKMGRQRRSPWN